MRINHSLNAELEALFQRNAGLIKPGLERISELLEMLDNPHRLYLTIHIAGTNGKGSVAAMLESILRAAGLKTGLYTSPHLVDFSERIKIDGVPVDADSLGLAMAPVLAADADRVAQGSNMASFFEMGTAIAFQAFAECGVEVAVVETGMGGRWDSTNVLRPVVSAITPIAIEHSRRLGDTLAQIAGEKAGIIKRGTPVVVAGQEPEARAVFERVAAENGAPLRWVDETVSASLLDLSLAGQKLKLETSSCAYPPVLCPLLGQYQVANSATALAAAEEFFAACNIELDPKTVKTGIEQVRWPGRGQILSRDPLVILDGAHNPAAADALAELLRQIGPGRKLGLIASFLSDKDAAGFMRAFTGNLAHCWIVPLDTERAMPVENIVSAVKTTGSQYSVCSREEADRAARQWAVSVQGMVCVTGSLYLVGEFLK